MLIIPAIDLKGGKCVRLVEGREESARIYDRDPLEVAHEYGNAGVERIHIVDLDGAFRGSASENRRIVQRIVESVNVAVEVGGGVRSVGDIADLIEDTGVGFVIVGTMAVEAPEQLREALKRFGERVIVGIDARGSEVAIHGWKKATAASAVGLARRVVDMGAQRIIYTDIERDGRLEGPNIEMTRLIARQSGVRVTASGGVGSLEDIRALRELEKDGVDSVIVGKALYEGRFTIEQALAG